MHRDKIIVTGGLGYIGSITCISLYEAGYEPIIIDNLSNSNIKTLGRIERIIGSRLSFYSADCRDISHLTFVFRKESPIKGVIHFAALKSVGESVKDPISYYDNNLYGLLNIIKCIDENNIDLFVFSSSCTVYGQQNIFPVSEDSTLNDPTNPYGFSKYAGERIIRDWGLQRKKGVVLLRYFNPIGAHESYKLGELPNGIPTNLVPYIAQSAIGKRGEIIIHGKDYDTPDGTCIRDYVNVCDLADAHVRSLNYAKNNPSVECFNIGTGSGISVLDVIKTFEAVNNIKLNYSFGNRREGDVDVIYSECKKAKDILGWRSRLTLSESLKSSWEWEKYLREDS